MCRKGCVAHNECRRWSSGAAMSWTTGFTQRGARPLTFEIDISETTKVNLACVSCLMYSLQASLTAHPQSKLFPSPSSKVWNDPMYEKPVPPPLSLPPNYEEAPTVDSRTPISVRVKRADSWKGPPQHKVSNVQAQLEHGQRDAV